MKFEWVPVVLLIVLSAEVLVRRWFFGQVPSQFGAAPVYLILLANLGFVAWRLAHLRRERRSRLQKN